MGTDDKSTHRLHIVKIQVPRKTLEFNKHLSSKSDSILIPNMLCGGVGEDQIATEGHEIHEVCNAVKDVAASKLNKEGFEMFVVKGYKSQVVAGTNFFAKVQIASDDHLHLRIYRNLQGKIELHSLKEGKADSDPIEYF